MRSLILLLTARTLWLVAGYFLQHPSVQRHHIESSSFILAALLVGYIAACRGSIDVDHTTTALPMRRVLPVALLTTLLLYWPALDVGFLSDDYVLAEWARRHEFAAHGYQFVRPVALVVWAAVLSLGGSAAAVHALTLLLHSINAALTFALGRRSGLSERGAALAAILFLVWPTQVEAVAWGAGIFDALMTTWTLAACVLFLRPGPFTLARSAVIVLLTVLAVYTKETALALPALIAVLRAGSWFRRRPSLAEGLTVAIMGGFCAGYLGWRLLLRPTGAVRPVLTRFLLKEQLSRCFGTLGAPLTNDEIARAPWTAVCFCSLVVVLIVGAMLVDAKRAPVHTAGLRGAAWSLIATMPAIGYFFVGADLDGSRYLYLAAAGWSMLIAAAADRLLDIRSPMRAFIIASVVFLLAGSAAQTRELLADWVAAGTMRDALLDKAQTAADRERCGTVAFAGLPPTYKGAQLFQNGFDEAFHQKFITRVGPLCDFRWDGSDFRRR